MQMRRLTNDENRTVSNYVKTRFSHKDRSEQKHIKKQIIKKLKQSDKEVRKKFMSDVTALFERSNLDSNGKQRPSRIPYAAP